MYKLSDEIINKFYKLMIFLSMGVCENPEYQRVAKNKN